MNESKNKDCKHLRTEIIGINKYEEWLEEFIAINSNPKLKMVGIPITRKEYYKTYFPRDFDPKKVYDQYVRIMTVRFVERKDHE